MHQQGATTTTRLQLNDYCSLTQFPRGVSKVSKSTVSFWGGPFWDIIALT